MAATLLVADDSVTIQRVIELTFANEDIRVVATSDGESALQTIDAEPPDVVLADVGMPKRDGYELAGHIKRTPALKHIPVLLLTGAFDPIDEARAKASGCDGVLVKPIDPQQLVGRVRELLEGRRTAALWPENLPRLELPAPPTEPRHADWEFQQEMERLDRAFAEIDPEPVTDLDVEIAPDFARDLHVFRSGEGSSVAGTFGDWDLPRPASQPETSPEPSAEPSAWDLDAAEQLLTQPPEVEKLEPPVAHEPRSTDSDRPVPEQTTPAALSRPSLAAAFAALLAAEQAQPVRHAHRSTATMSEVTIEGMVRRVLTRMTEETVRRIVLDAAERLIREEIERMRANPD